MIKTYFTITSILFITSLGWFPDLNAEVNKTEEVAPGVYFHEGDVGRRGHCNNGWIVFKDFVLVVDANFPSGAKEVIPKIRAITDKPIRFAFDTHHHGDHAYGNQVWFENGATIVAHEGALMEMKKYETGLFGSVPGRWEDTAKNREDVANSKLKPPTLLFRNEMIFDDGQHRVELLHFGTAHTRGDGFAWLPKEKILFTGDACVNGPYNYTGDGNITAWEKTLLIAQKLGATTICPGHGPSGDGTVLADQILFFNSLMAEVKKLVNAGKTEAQVKESIDAIKASLKKQDRLQRYVGSFFLDQVTQAYREITGTTGDKKKTASLPHKPTDRSTVIGRLE